jgi:hypothetical protein
MAMTRRPDPTDFADPRRRAEIHVAEAERLLKSWWLSSHVEAQVHATLALYYTEQADRPAERTAAA